VLKARLATPRLRSGADLDDGAFFLLAAAVRATTKYASYQVPGNYCPRYQYKSGDRVMVRNLLQLDECAAEKDPT
jgi:hypothetical protein